jgi:hypothetical protein
MLTISSVTNAFSSHLRNHNNLPASWSHSSTEFQAHHHQTSVPYKTNQTCVAPALPSHSISKFQTPHYLRRGEPKLNGATSRGKNIAWVSSNLPKILVQSKSLFKTRGRISSKKPQLHLENVNKMCFVDLNIYEMPCYLNTTNLRIRCTESYKKTNSTKEQNLHSSMRNKWIVHWLLTQYKNMGFKNALKILGN